MTETPRSADQAPHKHKQDDCVSSTPHPKSIFAVKHLQPTFYIYLEYSMIVCNSEYYKLIPSYEQLLI